MTKNSLAYELIEKLTETEKQNLEDIIKNLKEEDLNAINGCMNCTSPTEQKDESSNTSLTKEQTIFRAFDLFDLSETKVLILGQDPYPEPDKAHGLAFSVKNKKKRAASLTKIFKAVDICYGFKNKKRNYNLEQWAINNKVLLLNISLTYTNLFPNKKKKDLTYQERKKQANEQNRHMNAWQNFIYKILEKLFKNEELIVFLWGDKAKELFNKYKFHQNIKNENVYITCHPKKRFKKGEVDQFLREASEHFKEFDSKFSNKDKIWKNLWNYVSE